MIRFVRDHLKLLCATALAFYLIGGLWPNSFVLHDHDHHGWHSHDVVPADDGPVVGQAHPGHEGDLDDHDEVAIGAAEIAFESSVANQNEVQATVAGSGHSSSRNLVVMAARHWPSAAPTAGIALDLTAPECSSLAFGWSCRLPMVFRRFGDFANLSRARHGYFEALLTSSHAILI